MSILDDLVRLQFGNPIKESAADIIQAINTQKQMKEMPDIISNIENALTATNEQTESGTTPGTSTSQLGRIGNVLSATLEGVKKLQEAGGNTQLVNTPIALSSLILSGLSSGANIEGTLAGAQAGMPLGMPHPRIVSSGPSPVPGCAACAATPGSQTARSLR